MGLGTVLVPILPPIYNTVHASPSRLAGPTGNILPKMTERKLSVLALHAMRDKSDDRCLGTNVIYQQLVLTLARS